jgi:hypothetical protein
MLGGTSGGHVVDQGLGQHQPCGRGKELQRVGPIGAAAYGQDNGSHHDRAEGDPYGRARDKPVSKRPFREQGLEIDRVLHDKAQG